MSKATVTTARTRLRGRAVPAAVFVCVAAIVSGCETKSTVSETSPTSLTKCQVVLSTPPMIDAAGGKGTLSVTTQPECAWTASSGVSWISAVAPGSGQGTRDVEFEVAANSDVAVREGEIVVNDSRVRVSQRAACRYAVTPANQTVGATGGDSTISVAAGPDCAWTATTDDRWISLHQPVSGSGNGTVGFTVETNGPTERVGNVIVAGQRGTITQAAIAVPCTFTISPLSQNFVAAGGGGSINVSTQNNCRWTARSNNDWIVVTSDSNGNGSGSVNFRVAANTGAARTGTLSVEDRSFTVTQAAFSPSCSYTISPPSLNVAVGGGSGSVNVTTASTCAWTAVSNAAWITVTGGAVGTGNGSVAYTVAANTGAARNGTVTIAGQAFTVNQAAAPVPPTTSNAGWIVGNGTVTAAVSTNTGGQRTGTLTIAGQTATIQQRPN